MKKFYDYESDAQYLLKRVKVGKKYGVIVDFSNSHGLCFGVVFPNTNGSYGREDSLTIEWIDEVDVMYD